MNNILRLLICCRAASCCAGFFPAAKQRSTRLCIRAQQQLSNSSSNPIAQQASSEARSRSSSWALSSVVTANGDTTSQIITLEHDNKSEKTAKTPVLQFTTAPMKVYIEDTDAYGIIYNANYLKFYDRALHRTSFDLLQDDSMDASLSFDVLQHEGWSIVGVQSMRYKQSPPLGGSFVVTGERVDVVDDDADADADDNIRMETWNLAMTSVDGTTVYNTAEGLQIARPPPNGGTDGASTGNSQKQHNWLPPTQPLMRASDVGSASTTSDSTAATSFSSVWTDVFPTYRDEFDPHLTTHMPLTNLLNLFERARSNMLGGPEALRRLQQEANTLLVVTSNQDLALVEEASDSTSTAAAPPTAGQQPLICPGQSVTIETVAVWKRRGTVVDCHQSAFSSATGQCLGQGVTTILAIDADTKRPVRSMPPWIMDRFAE